MEPANGGGLGGAGALAMALITALLVLMMVNFGGGVRRPLFGSTRVAAAQSAQGQG